ncbi:hypothetical protein GCM10009037_22400 [Halarchaeum grantii]|uniref:Uncharacterized protein n=1 Tax=Halarchaeum grantii TaxID=1193105 RepID=A0A830F406_9EURY|nr:hypothetical protein [Halarchaeum grantii]GGL38304.1 hypothetical protein GCM10009037_22400 [Halarchaeum grantii]
MCIYCSAVYDGGWGQLLEYDDLYQDAMGGESTSTHGFQESWDDLREELGV